MKDVTVYQYPNCSTCKKALKWLAAHDIAYTAIDIVKSPPTSAQLENVSRLSNTPVRKMFNTSGVSYREGNFKDKLEQMTEKQALSALAKDGKLIKRPLVASDELALVGFSESAYESAFTRARRTSK